MIKCDMKYLNEHIKEEIHGASEYMQKALEAKEYDNAADAQMYFNMAMQEVGHAETLIKMLDEHRHKWDEDHPKAKGEHDIYRDMWDEYHADMMEDYEKLKDKINKHR